jgi:quercetin dioxygenase-like cupin family protein
MRITRGREPTSASVRKTDTYSGGAWQQMMLESSEDQVRVILAFFEPAGRTYWHKHTRGQLLFVSGGHGRIATDAGDRSELNPGDVVYSPPGERHWHGAAPRSVLHHIAVSLGSTEWFSQVTAAEYDEGF